MTLSKREISISLIDVNAPKDAKYDRIDLSGHRAELLIDNPGGNNSWGRLGMRIFGMSEELMNRFSVLGGRQLTTSTNLISVDVGDELRGRSRAFQGNIFFAYQEMTGAPDVSFNVSAVSGLFAKVIPAAPNGFSGVIDVAATIRSIAMSMKMTFRNNGVSTKLVDHYLSGSMADQIKDLAKAADINYSVDNGRVSIWPRGKSSGDLIVDVGPDNGMVGYPSFNSRGISVRTMFNAGISLGCDVNVTSSMKNANGKWNVARMRHELSSMVPDGPWHTVMDLTLRDIYAAN